MITPVLRRRRAERFAQLLDVGDGGQRHLRSSADAQLAPLVALAKQLRRAADPANPHLPNQPQVDPQFRAGLRAMLVATAMREGIGAAARDGAAALMPDAAAARSAVRTPRRARSLIGARQRIPATSYAAGRSRARAAVIVGVAAGTLALSGVTAASGDAVPGDALYGMKRSTERAQLALAGSSVGRGQLYLDFAGTRMVEARSVRTTARLNSLLDDMDAETRQGVRLLTSASVDHHDPAVLDWVDAFVNEQRGAMAELLTDASGERRERLNRSLALLDAIAERTDELRWALRCAQADKAAPITDGVDELGPRPAACVSPNRRPPAGTGLGPPDWSIHDAPGAASDSA